MKVHASILFSLILLVTACVDRINIDIGSPPIFPIVIDGSITNTPGPYTVRVSKAFDIESKLSIKTPIKVRTMVLSDSKGNAEVLSEVRDGEYQTDPNGMQGVIGRAYRLHIELLDGRIYESVPDTLVDPGQVDSLYYTFTTTKDTNGAVQHGFDVLFDASATTENDVNFMWKFTGTFKADTHPELRDIMRGGCEMYNGKCNWLPPCSGLLNVANPAYPPNFERVKPCECCTCWYNIFNQEPILSDNQFHQFGRFHSIKAYSVPLDEWIFMYKIYVEVDQLSLTKKSFAFWSAVKDQKLAVGSLFQPVTGKIKGNIVQVSGNPGEVEGLFYAASISSKSFFITRDDVPSGVPIPDVDLPWTDSCLGLFPNASTTKPSFWVD